MHRVCVFFVVFVEVLSLCFGWISTPTQTTIGSISTKSARIYSRGSNRQLHSSLENAENSNANSQGRRSPTATTSDDNIIRSRSSSSNEKPISPWKNSIWKITFDFGRENGSWMPEEWGKEGGRLVLSPLEVEITSDRPKENSKEDVMLKRNAWVLRPIKTQTSTYITMKGEQKAKFDNIGGWKIRMPWGGTSAGSSSSTIAKQRGHASKLMCYVDLQSDISKGDIKLSKGERIYMTGKCWREDDLENALKTMYPIRADFLEAQSRLEAQLQHETGDRRLDGTDPIQTIMGMKDTAQLVLQRDEALRKYEDARLLYPNFDDDDNTTKEYSTDDIPLEEGPWPGQVEWLSIEPGYLLVRRSKFLDEEYHVVGKWKAEPVFDDDDQESPSIF